MKFDIVTVFPEAFESYLSSSIIGRAIKKKLIKVNIHNLRRWTSDKRKTVDDRPFGGGPGMVLKVEPIAKAIRSLTKQQTTNNKQRKAKIRIILLSAKGKLFSQKDARRLARYKQLILISGRYEGVDERVKKYLTDEELSIGQYVLTGGELPAMVVIDACARLIPGVLGKQESLQDESFSEENYLEYPQYTRPETFGVKGKNRRVPKVLLSGDHRKIKEWREKNSKFGRQTFNS